MKLYVLKLITKLKRWLVKLEPCILCQSEADFKMIDCKVVVFCTKCGIQTTLHENAIKSWNQRIKYDEKYKNKILKFDELFFEEYNKKHFTYEFFKAEKSHVYRYIKPLRIHLELS